MPENKTKPKQPEKKRNGVLVAAIVLVVSAFLVAGLYRGIPEVTRYILRSEVAKLGINVHREPVIHWNIFRSEMSGGPVEFWSADSEPGVIKRIALEYNLEHLFDRRASLETIVLEGIDLKMKRKTVGTYTLNGVDLSEFLTAETERPEEQGADPWGVGANDLLFLDSQLVLVDEVTGGTLVLAIERLKLERFRSWAPDTPGSFDLKGSTNGIQLVLKGEAAPFADEIIVSLEGGFSGATLGKVAKFTGPLGLERQDGVLNARFKTELTVVEGRVEETTKATLTIKGVDVGGAKTGSIEVDDVGMHVDVQTVSHPDSTNKLNGSIGLTLGATKLRGPDGAALNLAGGTLDLQDLDIDHRVRAGEEQETAQGGGGASSTVMSLVDLFIDLLTTTIKSLADDELSGQGSASLELGAVRFDMPGAEQLPETNLSLASGKVNLQDVTAKSSGNTISVRGKAGVALGALATSVSQGGGKARIKVGGVELAMTVRKAEDADGLFKYDLDISTDVAALDASTPGTEGRAGPDVNLQSFHGAYTNVTGTRTQNTGKVSSSSKSVLHGLNVSIPRAGGAMAVSADQITVSMPTLESETGGGERSVDFAGSTKVSVLRAELPAAPGRPEMEVGIASLGIGLDKIATRIVGEETRWLAAVDAKATEISAEIKSEPASSVNVGSVAVSGVTTDQSMALAIGEIVIGGIQADLTDSSIKAFGGEATKKFGESREKNPAPIPEIRLGRVVVGSGSTVNFTDTSVLPPAGFDVDLKHIEVTNIDTSNPGQHSDLKLTVDINEFTKIALSGWATPLKTPKPDFDLLLDVDHMELPIFSPYVDRVIGLHLDSGTLHTSIHAAADSNALKGNVNLLIDDLDVSPVTPQDAEEFKQDFYVSPGFAANVLKDENGSIRLSLPVSGTLDNPNIEYDAIIKRAIVGAIRTMFGGEYEAEGEGMVFRSVIFAPGSAVLDDQGKAIADQYVAMLEQEAKIFIDACGRATAEDYAALLAGGQSQGQQKPGATSASGLPAAAPVALTSTMAKALVALAMERTEVVRTYFIEDKGIDTARVSQCRVTFDLRDTRPPRVQFSL